MILKQIIMGGVTLSRHRFFACRNSASFVEYLRLHGCTVGDNVRFRYPKHTTIDLNRPSLIELGSNLDINDNFTIMTHDFGTYVYRNLHNDFIPSSGRVKIGSNIYFGRDVTVLKGATIGDNCIIGLGSVVTGNIPSGSVAVGAPCRVISSIDEYFEKRRKRSVQEAIDYGRSIIQKLHRQPRPSDFFEEWSLFLSKEDYETYPEFKQALDFRIKGGYEEWTGKDKRVFSDFNEFLIGGIGIGKK